MNERLKGNIYFRIKWVLRDQLKRALDGYLSQLVTAGLAGT